MLLVILRKWCICVLCFILTYMKHICILMELPNISVPLLYKYIDITGKKKILPLTLLSLFETRLPKYLSEKCVFILIKLHHTRTKHTMHLSRLAVNTAFINPIKSGLIQNVAFIAIPITSYLLVSNTPCELLP